jgi:hypothetical protein
MSPPNAKRRRVRSVPTFSLNFHPSHSPLKPSKLLSLVRLLNVLGPTMAVAIDANNVVLDGNYVLYVMMLLGKKSIDVVDADGLSPEQVRALRLSTDRFRHRSDPGGLTAWLTRLQLDGQGKKTRPRFAPGSEQ